MSQAALDADLPRQLGLARPCLPVQNTRDIGKAALHNNNALPNISVNPETYEVYADGELLTCEPAEILPMAQLYFLLWLSRMLVVNKLEQPTAAAQCI